MGRAPSYGCDAQVYIPYPTPYYRLVKNLRKTLTLNTLTKNIVRRRYIIEINGGISKNEHFNSFKFLRFIPNFQKTPLTATFMFEHKY
uniref:Uncharacterized protein n=1 Tax=Thermococcus sp. IRI33 TaxID=1197733 RepID=L0BAQ0_9EURY|nr:hypothetical protein i33-14 [Thermococcus sp. IRI33]